MLKCWHLQDTDTAHVDFFAEKRRGRIPLFSRVAFEVYEMSRRRRFPISSYPLSTCNSINPETTNSVDIS